MLCPERCGSRWEERCFWVPTIWYRTRSRSRCDLVDVIIQHVTRAVGRCIDLRVSYPFACRLDSKAPAPAGIAASDSTEAVHQAHSFLRRHPRGCQVSVTDHKLFYSLQYTPYQTTRTHLEMSFNDLERGMGPGASGRSAGGPSQSGMSSLSSEVYLFET